MGNQVLACAATVFGGAANYLAFVITSRTWSGNELPESSRSLWFQLTHHDVLHSFVSTTASNTNPLQETWQMYLVIGLLASPLIFWRGTRKPWPLGSK